VFNDGISIPALRLVGIIREPSKRLPTALMGKGYRATAVYGGKHDPVLVPFDQTLCVNNLSMVAMVAVSSRVHKPIQTLLIKPEEYPRV
jgi:hypothetical protein